MDRSNRGVDDRPIVRRIDGRDLYLGDGLVAIPGRHDRTFDFVLSLTDVEYPLTTHHRPLADGPGNDWSAFEAAVDSARGLFRRDASLLIHCTIGVSRSSTIVATTLGAEEGRRFDDALSIVREARPSATPHPALHELAVVYLAERS